METKTFRTKPEFPVRFGEQITVRDGSGIVVERWSHLYSEPGKKFSTHTYAIDSYRYCGAL